MAVQVRHRLRDGVVHRNEGPLGAKAFKHRGGEPLGPFEETATQVCGKLGERDQVLTRDQENVALENGADIEEGNEVVVGQNDVGSDRPSGNVAEQASHGGRLRRTSTVRT